jgi:Protein of unknown function (DUF3768)
MSEISPETTSRIRQLNDKFRHSFVGGAVMITPGVDALPIERRRALLNQVQTFDKFDCANDPYGEHDFGYIQEGRSRYFWKIEYYDREMTAHSPDAGDPSVTTRVLTVMLAEEY